MLNRKLILIGAIILLFASVLNFNINPAHAGGSSTIFAQQLFVPDDVVVGSPTINYQDPEFLPGGSQMVFQDANRDVWIANLNLQTGLLRSTTGLDIAVDQAISEISTTANGPEWGVDSSGVSVFYTKPDINGINQIWRATLRGSLVTKRKLIERPQGAYGSLTSQDDTASTVKVAYGVGSIGSGSVLAWSDETIPTQAIVVPDYSRNSAGARWLPGGQDFTYSRISSELPLRSQIVRYRTANQSIEVIAEENGTISDVWGFLAPEFNNELLYVATINHQQVYVYRFINDNWTRFASLKLPSEATQRFIYSLEPVQGLRGFNGTSYFSLVAYNNNNTALATDSAIWVFGLGTDPNNRLVRRVDEGAVTGEMARRSEPETQIGTNELFVYYNKKTGNIPQLRRARTAIVKG